MNEVVRAAKEGWLVLGTCNGFQVLCEVGLLPGAPRAQPRVTVLFATWCGCESKCPTPPFTHGCPQGTILRMPIAHGEGCYFADANTLRETQRQRTGRDALLRCDRARPVRSRIRMVPSKNIAGICNREGNVFGLMPHPDRALRFAPRQRRRRQDFPFLWPRPFWPDAQKAAA